MTRVKRAESCLFCGSTPCTCNQNIKTERKAKPIVKARETPAILIPSDIDFGDVPREPTRFKVVEETKLEVDLSFTNALRSLREIVSPRDQRWIDSQLNPPRPQTLDRRISEWRRRHDIL